MLVPQKPINKIIAYRRLGITLFTLITVLLLVLESLFLFLSPKLFFLTLSTVLLLVLSFSAFFILVSELLANAADIFTIGDDYGFVSDSIWYDFYKSRSLPRMWWHARSVKQSDNATLAASRFSLKNWRICKLAGEVDSKFVVTENTYRWRYWSCSAIEKLQEVKTTKFRLIIHFYYCKKLVIIEKIIIVSISMDSS